MKNKILIFYIIFYILLVVGSVFPTMLFKTFQEYLNSGIPFFSIPLVVIASVFLVLIIRYSEPLEET